jgi:hypothetical protein
MNVSLNGTLYQEHANLSSVSDIGDIGDIKLGGIFMRLGSRTAASSGIEVRSGVVLGK